MFMTNNKCPICKSEESHKFTGDLQSLARYPLTVQDWEDIHNFMYQVYLPFIHGILANAERRTKKELT